MRRSCGFVRLSFCAAVAFSAGCTSDAWRGQGYDKQTQALTENLRPPADESELSGVDSRARDIERNLGVR